MKEADTHHTQAEIHRALLLIAMSIVGVGIGYSSSIVVARFLGHEAFPEYAVVVATMGLLCAVAEAGVGKYAFKAIPGYAVSKKWSLASGYWRFSVRAVLFFSVALAVCVALSEWAQDNDFGDHPLGIAAWFLPAAAVCGLGIDLVMASRAPITGMFIARMLLPMTTLIILVAVHFLAEDFTPTVAIVCYGAGSVAGAIYCIVAFRWTAPPQLLTTPPEYHRKEWLPQCAYFAAFGFLASWTLKISLIVLEILPIPNSEVACFAAAMETGCLILLLAKSTDKLFQPEMAVILAQKGRDAGARLRRIRYLLMGSGCGVFMLVIILFGRGILSLYGTEFLPGYPALCFVSFGACVTTMFSLAPALLRFSGRNRFVIGTTIGGAISMAAMTALLGSWYGATGAGIAFGGTLTWVALLFLFAATRHFSLLMKTTADHPQIFKIPPGREVP